MPTTFGAIPADGVIVFYDNDIVSYDNEIVVY